MATNEYRIGSALANWPGYNITFVVTEDCNLRCKYCYQVHKNNKKVMSLEVAKQAVDYFLDNPDFFNAQSVTWDFIGGEPLLEMDLIDQITDYIKVQTYKKNHPWFNSYRFNFSTNGILYHKDNVRRFIKKNPKKYSIGFSIDGNRDKHDAQRVYADGRGSYDEVVKNVPIWLEDMPFAVTKVTIGHEDIPYLKESIIHLWDLGIKNIVANVVFEDVWQDGDDVLFEQQLRELADYILENKLWNSEEYCLLFDHAIGYPNSDSSLGQNHCGSGKMIAIDADGNFYPCLRYKDYSLTYEKPYIIGNIKDGIDFDKVRPFLALSTSNQSDEECLDCEIATGCAWCQAFNYDSSGCGTNYQRATYICKMHKARCRANNYYWGRLDKDFGVKKDVENPRKRYLYFIMADDAIEHCNYKSKPIGGSVMSEDTLSQAFMFAEENFYTPVILHSKNTVTNNLNSFSKNERIEIVSEDKKMLLTAPDRVISVIEDQSLIENLAETSNCVLNIDEKDVANLAAIVEQILMKATRININLRLTSKDFDLQTYEQQLQQIAEMLLVYYKSGQMKEVNLITDRMFLKKMDNCEAGNYNYAVAPNGKIYICPAFYFADADSAIGSLEEGIQLDRVLFKLKNAPYCSRCDAYQCSRCVFLNKSLTNELNIPSSLQCKKSHLERTVSQALFEKLVQEGVDLPAGIELPPINYVDPLELVINKPDISPYNLKNC